ncbi:Heat stress transcription factor [Seminavis robusta]|uniref:Heat stress transcription factor n=1 Tax=Seminavis robusta TaxID=568900 RepID=A0A9N8F1C0_9STRA|nr:Heat stress transcription factor [Seminavis robusta]|eukprot:Sro2558_g331230.1 Heat stress transcription factor (287) ;mRNA; f:11411-12271
MKAPSPTMDFSELKSSFPRTLHKMLTEIDARAERDGDTKLQQIISWQEHGMAFKIHDRKKLMDLVMPVWFPRLKYSSWVRQLNSYGFKRVINEGNDKSCVYHEKFLRDMPEMAATIDRVPRKKKSSTTESDPAFDSFSAAPVPAPSFGLSLMKKSSERKCMSAPPSTSNGLHDLLLRTKTSNNFGLPSTPWNSAAQGQQQEQNLLGMHIFVPGSKECHNSDDDDSAADMSMFNAFNQASKAFDTETEVVPAATIPWDDNLFQEDMEPLRVFAPGTSGSQQHFHFQP